MPSASSSTYSPQLAATAERSATTEASATPRNRPNERRELISRVSTTTMSARAMAMRLRLSSIRCPVTVSERTATSDSVSGGPSRKIRRARGMVLCVEEFVPAGRRRQV